MKGVLRYTIGLIAMFWSYTNQAQETILLDSSVVSNILITPEHIINTPNVEYSPVYFGDNIGYVYSSDRGRKVDKAIDEPFHDLGYAAKDTSGLLGLSASFSSHINSLGHEGPFTTYKEEIYFTRVVPTKINGKKGFTRKIYGGNIYEEDQAPISWSTDKVSACHPTISSDGQVMIFSADMTQEGHMDLYQSSYIGNKWSTPERLVGDINTASHELFPYFYQDSILIFTSDRLGGFGGYDLYASSYRGGSWTIPQLVPAPINSQWDDLGMILRGDGKKGYFASNRPGGEGKDDIYNFKSIKSILYKPKVEKIDIDYKVIDKLKFTPIANAQVKITQLNLSSEKLDVEDYNVDLMPGTDEGELVLKLSPKKGKVLPIIYSDENGTFSVKLSPKSNYIITTTKDGYESSTFIFSSETYGNSLDIILEPKQAPPPPPVVVKPQPKKSAPTTPKPAVNKVPKEKPVKKKVIIPIEKGATIVFDNIYYDRNSVQIKKGAARELDALVDAMLLNPSMEVQLISHTDSRGEANYNLMLSEERALSAKMYLIERGVKSSRIKTSGKGEKEIRNECKNGTPCDDSKHKYNRRTEVKILKI